MLTGNDMFYTTGFCPLPASKSSYTNLLIRVSIFGSLYQFLLLFQTLFTKRPIPLASLKQTDNHTVIYQLRLVSYATLVTSAFLELQ
jgi:hypothetical protein